MSKITLVSFYPGFFGLNLRIIGSYLSEAGFDVNYLHLGYANYQIGEPGPSFLKYIDVEKIIDLVLPEIYDSLYIGISLSACEFAIAREFTIALKKRFKIPVIWGGPHPTASFDQCIPYADFVCVGEGEKTALELAEKFSQDQDVHEIPNLAFMKDKKVHLNPLHEIISDLDSLPLPDTNIYRQKIIINDELVELTPDILVKIDRIYKRPVPDKIIYITTLTRGCPYKCSYCNNSYLARIYTGQKYFRYRSLNHLFREVKQACENIKVVGAVFLADDNLTTLPKTILEDFANRWKDEIGIPFGTSGSPSTLKEEKLKILAQTGLLYKFGLGIESCSEYIIKEIYNRQETPSLASKAVEIVEKHRPLFFQDYLKPVINYQFIFDNPYETSKDISKSLRFIIDKISHRDSVTYFSLVMYPGSAIYLRAYNDSLADINKEIYMETYKDLKPTFTKVWLILFQKDFPRWLLKFLSIRIVFSFFDSAPFRWFYRIILPQIVTITTQK